MKKFLFGILTLIGIGFSFCSAELFIKPSRFSDIFGGASVNSSYVNSSDFNKFYINPSFDTIGVDTVCLSYKDAFSYWTNLDSIGYGVLGTGDDYKVMSNSAFWYWTGSAGGTTVYVLCIDFSENPLIVGKNEVVQFGFHCNEYGVRTGYNWDAFCNGRSWAGQVYFYSQYQLNDIPTSGNYFVWPSGNIFAGMSSSKSMFAGIGYSEVQLNPKFKVNYGSTSYEYELDSDLSIYLKSPVSQNGNTFTYVGSTGINLFYNGSSQFYNKDKLYLISMYWYNNNIFTPICL